MHQCHWKASTKTKCLNMYKIRNLGIISAHFYTGMFLYVIIFLVLTLGNYVLDGCLMVFISRV